MRIKTSENYEKEQSQKECKSKKKKQENAKTAKHYVKGRETLYRVS